VLEDVHWADDATLDVLGYAARRVESLPALIVLTYRDDEVGPRHPLQRLLGTLAGAPPLHRVALAPLSRAAVRRLAAGTGADADAVHRITAGNPFFVTEVLAAPGEHVPASVLDAVTARIARLSPPCRAALDRLSVVPTRAAPELLGPELGVLAEAEAAGVIEADASGLAFRHELARRAVEQSLPAIRRRLLNAAVLAVLQAQERPDPARLMHHALAADDVDTIVAVGPAAARAAAAAGSHRQALAHFDAVRPHLDRLPLPERAAMLDAHAWELYNAHRFREAVETGRAAARLLSGLGDREAHGACLVRLSRHLFMAGETGEAEEVAEQAIEVLDGRPQARLNRGAILAMTGDQIGRASCRERV